MASNSNVHRPTSAAQTADASSSSTSEARKRSGNILTAGTTVDAFADSREERQTRDRAIAILTNHQLMIRYALANDVSLPKIRMYFEKVAAGFDPKPIISNWQPFEE